MQCPEYQFHWLFANGFAKIHLFLGIEGCTPRVEVRQGGERDLAFFQLAIEGQQSNLTFL